MGFGRSLDVVLSLTVAALKCWFSRVFWLLRYNGSLSQFGCSLSMVLFQILAAHHRWFSLA